MPQTLERALIEKAWRDPDFADLLQRNPAAALQALGVEVPEGIKLDIRIQQRDTLYYVIPPVAEEGEDLDKIINQMDLWQSAELFSWIMPQALKVDLLAMRQSYRRNQG